MRKGFTLIEILIVVAIIAILASVVLIGLGPTQQQGRDARRLADLHQMQNAIELYFQKCGYYPGTAQAAVPCAAFASAGSYAGMSAAIIGSALGINVTPNDPTAGRNYVYAANANGSAYVLGATLESVNNSVFNTYVAPPVAGFTNGDALNCAAPNYCVTL